ncbi:hypothetical protein ACFY8K_17050 [Streptomyces misionensis]|uniref:hypothetical protein n=1 Tax=Streptomyces misionensis TaxID=67331 RepID=UPI0036A111A9
MNTKSVNAAAGVIQAAQQQDRTAAGIALALESAQLLQSPESAAEVEQLRARVAELEAQRDRRRVRLVALQNDALNIRGALSPSGEARKVPMPLGETLLPAVEWLINRVAELEAERHSTNEALSDAAEALREQRDRFETVRALCDAADHAGIVSGGWFTVDAVRRAAANSPATEAEVVDRLAEKLAQVVLEDPHDSPLHHRYVLGRDLPSLGGVE